MSASLLRGPGIKTHEVADDLESCMHVLNWLCLRFFTTMRSGLHLRSYVYNSYEQHTKVGDQCTGGVDKYQAIRYGQAMATFEGKGTPLKALVDALALMGQAHYQAVDPSLNSNPTGNTILGVDRHKDKMPDIYRLTTGTIGIEMHDPFADHKAVVKAFQDACAAHAADFPAKEEDEFATFKSKDIHTEHSRASSLYQSSAGSNRASRDLATNSSSDEAEEEPPEKKLKLMSTETSRHLPEETLPSIGK